MSTDDASNAAAGSGEGYADSSGVRIYYSTHGQTTAPLMICLHGFPDDSRTWRPILPALARGFFVVTPDLRGYTRSDDRIREDVCDRLSHGHFDPSEVSVKVAQGVVTLEGFVDERNEKFHAEEIAESVLGVKDVENRLRLKRGRERGAQESPQESRASRVPNGEGNPRNSA